MAVSDLTNTKWLLSDATGITGPTSYNIDFTDANSNIYNRFILYYDNPTKIIRYVPVGQTYINVCNGTTWIGDNYKTIIITGGTDATNATLIAWLDAHATQVVESGKTQIGNRAITKKTFGTREITKEVVNGVVVYEKQAPSGYNVSGTNDVGIWKTYTTLYSEDDGATWNRIPAGSFTLPAMSTFKLKLDPGADYLMSASSTQLGLNLPLLESVVQVSSNYTLTQDITDLIVHGEED